MAKQDFNQVSSSFETFYLRYCVLRYFVKYGAIACNGSPLLYPINATSSSSYVFRLQYTRVTHCRIVPIEKLKTLVALERKKPPITFVVSQSKRNTQIFIVFIINHKNTINIAYLVRLLWWRSNVS